MKNKTNSLINIIIDDKNRIKTHELWACYYDTGDDEIECDIFKRKVIYGYPFSKERYSSQKVIERQKVYCYTQCEGDVTLIIIRDINIIKGRDYSCIMNPGNIILEINNFDDWKKYECTNLLYEEPEYFLNVVREFNKNLPPEEKIVISPDINKTISYDQYKYIKQYLKLENQKEQVKKYKLINN